MSWTLNGIRIFVNKHENNSRQIMPTLQPLSGGTVVQFFGYETTIQQIAGIIVGRVDLLALQELTTTQLAYELTSPEGSLGNFYIKAVRADRLPSVYQTMRLDLDCESPVYSVSIDLQAEVV